MPGFIYKSQTAYWLFKNIQSLVKSGQNIFPFSAAMVHDHLSFKAFSEISHALEKL